MADDITPAAQPVEPVAPSGAAAPDAPVAPAAPLAPAPTEPVPVAEGPLDSGIIGTVVGTVATASTDDVSTLASPVLPTEAEGEHQNATEAAYRSVDVLEAAANVAPESIAAHTTGLLHTDTVYRTAEKLGNEGPRQEQVHTSL